MDTDPSFHSRLSWRYSRWPFRMEYGGWVSFRMEQALYSVGRLPLDQQDYKETSLRESTLFMLWSFRDS